MSDLVYQPAGGDAGFSVVGGGSGSDWFGNGLPADGGSRTTSTGSRTQTDITTVDYLIDNAGSNLGSLDNPYDKTVQTGTKHIDIYIPICGRTGCVMRYSRTIHVPIYGDNPAYYEYENTLTKAQTAVYNDVYNFSSSNYSSALSDATSNLKENYDNDRFGDINNISNYLDDMQFLESSIYDLQLQDELTSNYNRISDTNNSSLIQDQKEELSNLQSEYNKLTAEYDNKKFQDTLKALQNQNRSSSNSSDWVWDYNYIQVPNYESFNGYSISYNQDIRSSLVLNTTNELNRWMAGGDLYDAPRAGDVLFNPIGDMNTVKFLGLQNKNFTPNLNIAFANPDVYKSLGINAGDDNFSVL